jgi:hypothetical protein
MANWDMARRDDFSLGKTMDSTYIWIMLQHRQGQKKSGEPTEENNHHTRKLKFHVREKTLNVSTRDKVCQSTS